jgi:hypothetical protein
MCFTLSLSLMRAVIKERNVYRWAGETLLDAAELRLHVLDLVDQRSMNA